MDSGCHDSKKCTEERVLNDVFSFCMNSGGTRSRNAKRLAGVIRADMERPDLAIELMDGRVLGLEHFRVDHYVKAGKNADSKSAELAGRAEKQRKNVIALEDEEEFGTKALKALADIVQQERENSLKASAEDLGRSLNARLNMPGTGHAPKLPIYRKNLEAIYPMAENIELGFLIEFHTDFRGRFVHYGHHCSRLAAGECPLPEEVFDLLVDASSKVDWLLLAFYQTLEAGIVNAAIIDCRNGLFRKSCISQQMERAVYLELDKSLIYGKRISLGDAEFAHEGDKIKLLINKPAMEPDYPALLKAVIQKVAAALDYERRHIPFVASPSIEVLYETFHDECKRIKGPVDVDTVIRLWCQFPSGELVKRLNGVALRLGLTDEGTSTFPGVAD